MKPQTIIACAALVSTILLALQGATFSYVVSIERRLTRLETLQEFGARRGATVSPMHARDGLPPAGAGAWSSLAPGCRGSFTLTSTAAPGASRLERELGALRDGCIACSLPASLKAPLVAGREAVYDRAEQHFEILRLIESAPYREAELAQRDGAPLAHGGGAL